MPGDNAINILNGLWAEDGGRIDPDSNTLDDPVVRANGFPSKFSSTIGTVFPRRGWNQRFREWQGAAARSMRWGIEPYDALVNYPVNARCSVGQIIYSAVTANGPATSNVLHPTSVGQSVWSEVVGSITKPNAPDNLRSSTGNGFIDWGWDCPRDGGFLINNFILQWRGPTGDWSSDIIVMGNFYQLTGLTNGTQYRIRVKALTDFGESNFSSIGTATPQATRPSQIYGLVAFDDGDESAALEWNVPNNGGANITTYQIQWRAESGSFGTTNQARTTGTRYTVTSLVNGDIYFFRIRAINSVGNGPWSDETFATPAEPPPPDPVIPDDEAPGKPASGSSELIGTDILWKITPPPDGNRVITRFDFEYRLQGGDWISATSMSSCFIQRDYQSGENYQARGRARNTLGTGQWSDIIEQAT